MSCILTLKANSLYQIQWIPPVTLFPLEASLLFLHDRKGRLNASACELFPIPRLEPKSAAIPTSHFGMPELLTIPDNRRHRVGQVCRQYRDLSLDSLQPREEDILWQQLPRWHEKKWQASRVSWSLTSDIQNHIMCFGYLVEPEGLCILKFSNSRDWNTQHWENMIASAVEGSLERQKRLNNLSQESLLYFPPPPPPPHPSTLHPHLSPLQYEEYAELMSMGWKAECEGHEHVCRLKENVITPTTKAADHDVPISPEDIIAQGLMKQDEWDQVPPPFPPKPQHPSSSSSSALKAVWLITHSTPSFPYCVVPFWIWAMAYEPKWLVQIS